MPPAVARKRRDDGEELSSRSGWVAEDAGAGWHCAKRGEWQLAEGRRSVDVIAQHIYSSR
jgi:hypothetical protein